LELGAVQIGKKKKKGEKKGDAGVTKKGGSPILGIELGGAHPVHGGREGGGAGRGSLAGKVLLKGELGKVKKEKRRGAVKGKKSFAPKGFSPNTCGRGGGHGLFGRGLSRVGTMMTRKKKRGRRGAGFAKSEGAKKKNPSFFSQRKKRR